MFTYMTPPLKLYTLVIRPVIPVHMFMAEWLSMGQDGGTIHGIELYIIHDRLLMDSEYIIIHGRDGDSLSE